MSLGQAGNAYGDPGSSVINNTLYASNMVKAWGTIGFGASAGAPTIIQGFNVNTAVYYNDGGLNNALQITLHEALRDTNYVILATQHRYSGNDQVIGWTSLASSGSTFRLYSVNLSTFATVNLDTHGNASRVSFIIMGWQDSTIP